MLVFRKATEADMPVLLQMYAQGRKAIANLGIDQWQNGYPAEKDIAADLDAGVLWVSYDPSISEEPASVCAVILTGEPTYESIRDGAWLTGQSQKYTTIHRITVSPAFRGKGVAGQTMQFGMACGREAGHSSLRIDTHAGNIAMRNMLEKNGFTHCGTITLQSGEDRVAYEILL